MKGHMLAFEKKLDRAAPWLYLLLIIIAVVTNVILFHQQSKQDAKLAGDQAAIQQSRHDACVDQNQRHDQTIKTLNVIIDSMAPGPQKVQAKSSEKFTILLIDALAPKRDCDKLVPVVN